MCGMAKPIPPTSYLTLDGSRIYPASAFIYEVTTYKLFRKRAELINSKFFKSSKPLTMLDYKIIRKKDYILEQTVVWLGAPIEYIIDNNLPVFNQKKKKNEKGRSNVRKRKFH